MEELGRKQHKKTELRVSGGIAGLIALSGAIAAAALISVFQNRSKRRPSTDLVNHPSITPLEEVNCNKEEDGEGLRSLLQTPPPCEETFEREKDVLRICSTPIGSLGQENESDLGLNSKAKAQAFDDSGPVLDNLKESLPEADDHGVSEAGISVPFENMKAPENGSSKVVDNKEDPFNLQPAQTKAVTEENFENSEETMIPQMEELMTKEEKSVHDEEDDDEEKFEEEEEEEDEEDEEEEEEGEEEEEEDDEEEEEDEEEVEEFSDEKEGEGSDGTGDSSIESNAEAVWPTESFEAQGMKICGDTPTKAVKEEAEMDLDREFSVKTKKEYEENGGFKSTNATEFNMEKEKGVCALIILMEKAVPASSISRLLLLFVMVGLALHLLRCTMSYNLQDSTPNVV